MEAEEPLEPKFHVQEGQILTERERWMCSGPSRSDVSLLRIFSLRLWERVGSCRWKQQVPEGWDWVGREIWEEKSQSWMDLLDLSQATSMCWWGTVPLGRDFHPNL